MDYIKEKLYQQLAIDYCCQISDIKDDKNHFMKVLVTGFDPFGGESGVRTIFGPNVERC